MKDAKVVAAIFASAQCSALKKSDPADYLAWYGHFLPMVEKYETKRARLPVKFFLIVIGIIGVWYFASTTGVFQLH